MSLIFYHINVAPPVSEPDIVYSRPDWTELLKLQDVCLVSSLSDMTWRFDLVGHGL